MTFASFMYRDLEMISAVTVSNSHLSHVRSVWKLANVGVYSKRYKRIIGVRTSL